MSDGLMKDRHSSQGQSRNRSPFRPTEENLRRVHGERLIAKGEEEENGAGRNRLKYTLSQLETLEANFAIEQIPSLETRFRLAEALGITPRNVQIWFQNRRARSRDGRRDQPRRKGRKAPAKPKKRSKVEEVEEEEEEEEDTDSHFEDDPIDDEPLLDDDDD